MLDWAWIVDHLDRLAFRTLQHVYFAAIAIVIGFAISFVIGVIVSRARPLYPPATAFAGIIYTVPSLALFVALLPITGIGSVVTVEVPLVLYTLVILVRNVVAGLDSVPAEVLEAAEGMGLTSVQRLVRVQVPLAVPLMVAGLRVASVSTIGLVTISATLGDWAGGLGFFIYEGMNRFFPTETYVGAVPTILLALAADRFFVWLQARATPWTQRRIQLAGAGT